MASQGTYLAVSILPVRVPKLKPKSLSLQESVHPSEGDLKQVVVSLASMSRDMRKKEASKPLYLARYE